MMIIKILLGTALVSSCTHLKRYRHDLDMSSYQNWAVRKAKVNMAKRT
jgi:hypothetical protein